jgi:hypothetical protein
MTEIGQMRKARAIFETIRMRCWAGTRCDAAFSGSAKAHSQRTRYGRLRWLNNQAKPFIGLREIPDSA